MKYCCLTSGSLKIIIERFTHRKVFVERDVSWSAWISTIRFDEGFLFLYASICLFLGQKQVFNQIPQLIVFI